MPRTIEVKQRKPGRPPKYPQGTTTRHYRIPLDLEAKLRHLVESGKFESETEAIYHYVMFADKLDELFEKIRKLERRVEILEAENGALRQKITLIEGEKEQLKREKHELLKELESVIDENMRLKKGVQESKERKEEKIRNLEDDKERFRKVLEKSKVMFDSEKERRIFLARFMLEQFNKDEIKEFLKNEEFKEFKDALLNVDVSFLSHLKRKLDAVREMILGG